MSKRFVIITSYLEGSLLNIYSREKNDFIICADGGFAIAKNAHIAPDLIIGDFDSLKISLPESIETITLPVMKDDTDTGVCVDYALTAGADEILILGGLGGRLDHTLANLQTLAKVSKNNIPITIKSEKNSVSILSNGKTSIRNEPQYKISLLSYSEKCTGVTISGVLYPLENATLTNQYPIGVSNEFTNDYAHISVENGTLLIVLSKD